MAIWAVMWSLPKTLQNSLTNKAIQICPLIVPSVRLPDRQIYLLSGLSQSTEVPLWAIKTEECRVHQGVKDGTQKQTRRLLTPLGWKASQHHTVGGKELTAHEFNIKKPHLHPWQYTQWSPSMTVIFLLLDKLQQHIPKSTVYISTYLHLASF